jgi:plasmid maintenance system antidote protein VapI
MTIAEFLEANAISRRNFRERIEISESYMSRLVNRLVDPSFDIALKIHKVSDGKIGLPHMARADHPLLAE